MQVTEIQEGDILILNLKGDIDLHHSPKLREVLQAKVKAKCGKLLLDFSEVGYIDSSGLATLVEYYQGSRTYSGKICLAALSTRVKSVFDLVRLSEIFSISPSMEEAKESLK
jgi:anti-sigma B factor antagonist